MDDVLLVYIWVICFTIIMNSPTRGLWGLVFVPILPIIFCDGIMNKDMNK